MFMLDCPSVGTEEKKSFIVQSMTMENDECVTCRQAFCNFASSKD